MSLTELADDRLIGVDALLGEPPGGGPGQVGGDHAAGEVGGRRPAVVLAAQLPGHRHGLEQGGGAAGGGHVLQQGPEGCLMNLKHVEDLPAAGR